MQAISCYNYFIFNLPFKSLNTGQEERKLQELEYLKSQKSNLDEIKSMFHNIVRTFL